MKKHSFKYILFIFSFIMYSIILLVTPYVTAQMWADILMYIFCVAVCYQLAYVIYLRKKDNIKFGSALAMYFLCLFCSLEMYAVIYYADLFLNGYVPTDILGNQTGEQVYGLEAIRRDGWANFIFVPLFIVCTIYQIIYFVVVSRKRRK